MKEYEKSLEFWDELLSKGEPEKIKDLIKIAPEFDETMATFSESCPTVLDFGCGNGVLLYQCQAFGHLKKGLGIDPAAKVIKTNQETAKLSGYDNLEFIVGTADSLHNIADESYSGIILSNVIDVIDPVLVEEILEQLERILIINGKVLLKLNPYMNKEMIEKTGGSEFSPNMIEINGILRLCNFETRYWTNLISKYFNIDDYIEFAYTGATSINRLFLLTKKTIYK